MQDDEMAIEVVVPVEEKRSRFHRIRKTIWNEITAGVGIWGAFRPVFAVVLSLVPFLFWGNISTETIEEDLIGFFSKSHWHLL